MYIKNTNIHCLERGKGFEEIKVQYPNKKKRKLNILIQAKEFSENKFIM